MIPIIFFLGMNSQEHIWFQVTQTILDYVFVFLLLHFGLKMISQRVHNRRKVLITGLSIEGVHVISFFMWYFFVLYALGGFIIEILFLFIVPYFIIYLLHTQHAGNEASPTDQKSYLSTRKAFLLYLISVPPALILSSLLTSVLFNLIGIQNFFIFF